jgi:hypothetical protein
MAVFSRVAQQALRRNRMTAGGATQPLPTDGHGMALPPPRLARLGGACCLLMSVASSDASKRSAEHAVLATWCCARPAAGCPRHVVFARRNAATHLAQLIKSDLAVVVQVHVDEDLEQLRSLDVDLDRLELEDDLSTRKVAI